MTSKEALDFMYGVAIYGSGLGETGDKVRECYNIVVENLEELERCKQDEKILYKQDVVYLRQALQSYIDSPVLYATKTFGVKYIMSENYLKKLEKDLEVLEILKENANLYVSEFNKEVKYIQISITTCDKRFDKVEGWLNNEK